MPVFTLASLPERGLANRMKCRDGNRENPGELENDALWHYLSFFGCQSLRAPRATAWF